MNATAKPHRLPLWVWACLSVALHVLLAALWLGQQADRAQAAQPAMTMEAVALERRLPPEALEPEAKPAPAPARTIRNPMPKAAAKQTPQRQAPSPVPPGDAAPELPPSDGALEVHTAAGGTGSGSAPGTGPTGSGPQPGEQERTAGPPRLSLSLDVDAFTRLALVRPGIALLMAVPGFRDMLRGSGIRPFVDLRLVRVGLQGVAAERLTLAGVHGGGEQALLDVADRIAAMRNRKALVRGDADLRASAWEDGTGIDRGLAVHGGAFVIAQRTALPGLLGTAQPSLQVSRLSSMGDRVAMQFTVEDAGRYLPGMQDCGLQALRASIGVSGEKLRMALKAHYRAASSANAARTCMGQLQAGQSALSSLAKWLVRAESAQGRNSTSLQVEVTSSDIEQLLNELAWALRRA